MASTEWQFTHTAPKSSSRLQRSARPWSSVQTLAASPYRVPFAVLSASCSSVTRCTVTTGPKTSSIASSSLLRTPATTVAG